MTKIEIYEEALTAIANPIKFFLDIAELTGGKIDGQAIIAMSRDSRLLSILAANALKEGRSAC